MSTPINDGGPAFPNQNSEVYSGQREIYASQGMSLRDYFAAKALAGMLAEPEGLPDDNNALAGWAYALADAMLQTREATP